MISIMSKYFKRLYRTKIIYLGDISMKKLIGIVFTFVIVVALIQGCVSTLFGSDSNNSSSSSQVENVSKALGSLITESSNQTQVSNTNLQNNSKTTDTSTGNPLTVSYIDVGQGDSILIKSPNGKNMLIDAGESSSQTTIQNYIKEKGINKIDVLVATHPHADHIGGMAYIISNFDIGSIYMPKATTTTKTYETLLTTIKNKGLSINTAKAGVVIDFDSTLTVNMVAPIGSSYDDLNQYSAVIKITYKNNSFLFAGDAGNESEQQILNSGTNIKADVLKVGHHGSSTSSSSAFLNAVAPKYAIISVGKDNTYGHPTQSALDRLVAVGAKIYRTDDGGTVVITSDGQNITANRNASSYNSQAPPTYSSQTNSNTGIQYIGNKNSKKFHLPSCRSLPDEVNRVYLNTRDDAISGGYSPCGICKP